MRPRIVPLAARVVEQRTKVETVTARGRTTLSVPADVLFAFDSARVRPDAAAALRSVSDRVGETCVTVVGHTDDRGDADYNDRLSLARALAVRARLAVRCARIAGRGEAEPIASNRSAAGRARNRRVEFRL